MTNYDGREATGNKSCRARDEKIGRKMDERRGRESERGG